MRLVPFLLSAVLAAQAPGKLPWDAAPALPWKAGDCGAAPTPAPPVPAAGPLEVKITADGALRIVDERGAILLRTGLPGRPVQIWRDAGVPVTAWASPLPFPRQTRIAKGIGALGVGERDFRPALEGLLWILGDDGRVLTLIHPATARLCYLTLPGGRNFQVAFHPDRLELQSNQGGAAECWSIPWLALLPQFIQLGQENPAGRPSGTALIPYPKG